MKLNTRIPLIPTIIVVVVMGIITFVKIATKATFPTSYFIIWILVSVILIGITVWSWLRNKKK
jgi:lipopolysaccharide export LptBFGC system permease protein LptF